MLVLAHLLHLLSAPSFDKHVIALYITLQTLSQGRIYDKIVPITDKMTINNVIFVVFIHI